MVVAVHCLTVAEIRTCYMLSQLGMEQFCSDHTITITQLAYQVNTQLGRSIQLQLTEINLK